jgi:hypothetical protein
MGNERALFRNSPSPYLHSTAPIPLSAPQPTNHRSPLTNHVPIPRSAFPSHLSYSAIRAPANHQSPFTNHAPIPQSAFSYAQYFRILARNCFAASDFGSPRIWSGEPHSIILPLLSSAT